MPMHTAVSVTVPSPSFISVDKEATPSPSSKVVVVVDKAMVSDAPVPSSPLRTSPSLSSLLAPPLDRLSMRSSPSAPSLRCAGLMQECPSSPLPRSVSRDGLSVHRSLCLPQAGSLWLQTRQQLVLYVRLHGMVIGPLAAQRCLATFTAGRFLSIPSRYFDDPPVNLTASEVSRWDAGTPSLLKYCWWTLTSLRALSTLLCLTDIAEARDFEEADMDDFHAALASCSLTSPESSRVLESSPIPSGPSVQMHDRLFTYLLQHSGGCSLKNKEGKSGSPGAVTLKLARRVELNFRLAGTRLVALHFKAMRGRDVVKDSGGKEVVHVLEVHETSYSMLHVIATGIACGIMASVLRRR